MGLTADGVAGSRNGELATGDSAEGCCADTDFGDASCVVVGGCVDDGNGVGVVWWFSGSSGG